MKLIIGLGNPGEKYQNNRHNVGYMVIDRLQLEKLPKDLVAVKTNTYMNESGPAVKKLASSYSLVPSALYIIHDDLDIRLGEYKIQFGKGPKAHGGIGSIESALGTADFWRVRIGVENRDTDNRIPGEEYVLQDFTEAETATLEPVIKKVVKELLQRYDEVSSLLM